MKGIVPFWERYSKQPYQAQQPKSWSSPKPKGVCTCIEHTGTWVHFHILICPQDEKLKGQFWNPRWNTMANLSCWSFLDQFLLVLTYTKRFTNLNWLSPKGMITGRVSSALDMLSPPSATAAETEECGPRSHLGLCHGQPHAGLLKGLLCTVTVLHQNEIPMFVLRSSGKISYAG